jgi:hypothetical protein
MLPTEMISVRLFRQHIAAHLPEFASREEDFVLQTLQRALSVNVYDNAAILSKELQDNQVDFKEVLTAYISDLADHYVQNPNDSDQIIDQLLVTNFLSFATQVEEAKELQLAIQRKERKRLKELLRATDEEQEADDFRIAFERIERKELKKQLQEMEESSSAANYSFNNQDSDDGIRPLQTNSSNNRIWMRVAALLVLILIPVGIFLFRNAANTTFDPTVANNGDKPNVEDSKYLASQDISDLVEVRLPDASNKMVVSEIDSDIDRGQGYANEDDLSIEIEVVSRANQLKYLKLKSDSIQRKINDFKTKLKRGDLKKHDAEKLRKLTEQLQIARSKCDQLSKDILSAEMHYEFTLKHLTIYSNKVIDPKRYTVREEIDVDTRKLKYLLMLDGKIVKPIELSTKAK